MQEPTLIHQIRFSQLLPHRNLEVVAPETYHAGQARMVRRVLELKGAIGRA